MLGFSSEKLLQDLMLWPARMQSPTEYYRFLTAGFVHADYMHLAFNMFSFYFFADFLEREIGPGPLAAIYLLGIIVACIPSFAKNRQRPGYASLGASGGVAAIIFAAIYWAPWEEIRIFFSIPMPSIVFAVLYLIGTAYMARRGTGNINHDAHLWGAIFGFVAMIAIDPTHGRRFLELMTRPG